MSALMTFAWGAAAGVVLMALVRPVRLPLRLRHWWEVRSSRTPCPVVDARAWRQVPPLERHQVVQTDAGTVLRVVVRDSYGASVAETLL